MRLRCVLLVLVAICVQGVAACAASEAPPLPKALAATGAGAVIQSVTSDLDRDGALETVVITCKSREGGHPMGGEILVLRRVRGKLAVLWRQNKLNPWKLRVGDVDGDGTQEVVVGVWKKSPKDPVMAKRVFVYSWSGKRLMPKWLGSRLSRRFEDFELADVDGDRWQELLALEFGRDGKRRVSAYRWKSFGFEWLGCSAERAGLLALRAEEGGIFVVSAAGTLRLRYTGGRIILSRRRH